MNLIDIAILSLYFLGMISVGIYFLRRNKSADDYYVGGRKMSSSHVGLSVVATDVGGGFSIGLGGLGFIMGISGSWMLFTGLVGAWISGVFLIPKIAKMENFKSLLTFPQIFEYFFDKKVALVAGIISAIGYLGFTSSQILAGAKLASSTFINLDLYTALIIMGIIVVVYTFIGGIKAVIYTDTIQWIILLAGLIFIGIPMGYNYIGGYEAITNSLSSDFLSLTNIDYKQFINWFVTIVPIWFVGMTLYQRIFSCKSEKDAKKAWFIAGIFEWPIMAFMGVLLGLFARVAYEQGAFASEGFPIGSTIDAEIGLPLLLKTVLPTGFLGLMSAAYFSAIMSTADSCLMASSGNLVTDILSKIPGFKSSGKNFLVTSQITTLIIGCVAILLASSMQNVLSLMLYSYAFMVSGLFVPVLGCFFFKVKSSKAAMGAMIIGGSTTIILQVTGLTSFTGFDPNIFGILFSFLTYFVIVFVESNQVEVLDDTY